jgi:hypothetical protein
MVWMGTDDGMDATKWGWYQQDINYIPTMSNMNVALLSLLKVMHCNCGKGCNTQHCSCRKYMLSCSPACGPCQVETCNNPQDNQHLDDFENDE